MYEELKKDMVVAMKDKDKERLTIIRGIKSAVDLDHIDKKKEINDELVIEVVAHQVKLLNDSLEEFKKADRNDLVEKANFEMDVLKSYLPTPLTDSEVESIIDSVFNEVKPTSMKDMGKIMQLVTPKVKGRFDMSKISAIIKNKLI